MIRRVGVEAAAVVVLAVTSVYYATFAVAHARAKPDFYHLSAAIGVATGRGFVDPVPVAGSPLAAFLESRTQTLDWADATAARWQAPKQYIRGNQYLIYALGMTWKLTGISWSAVGLVAAAFHALLVLGAYATLRLFMPVPLAFAGAFWIAASSMNLRLLPELRDYSKGAFIVAILPMVLVLGLRARDRASLIGMAVLTGVVTGVGVGFKMDVAIMLPLAVVSIVAFRGRRPWSDLGEKGMALAAIGLAFAVAAGRVLASMSGGGSNAAHVILLGWGEGFDVPLGLGRSLYALLPFYNDSYLATVIQAVQPPGEWLPFTSREYDRAGLALWFQVARTFPADLAVRLIAAANETLNLGFISADYGFLDRAPRGSAQVSAVASWLHGWRGSGAWLGAALVAVAAAAGARLGLMALWLIVSLGGYSFLQFSDRHYFHTLLIPVFATLALLWAALCATMRKRQGCAVLPPAASRRVLAVAAVAVVVFIAPLAGLRAYQSNMLSAELEQFAATSVAKVDVQLTPTEDGTWRASWAAPADAAALSPEALRTSYYLAEFVVDEPRGPILVGIEYDAVAPDLDYSRVVAVQPKRGINLIGFATFSTAGTRFAGLELGLEGQRSLTAIHLMPAGPAGLPADLVLPADWREHSLYEHFGYEAVGPAVACPGNTGCRGLFGYLDAAATGSFKADAAMVSSFVTPIARPSPEGITVDGVVDSDSSYLLQLKDWSTTGRAALVVEGRLNRGGLVVGLLKDARWYRQAFITRPGDFLAVVPVDEAGVYQPLLTSALSPSQRRNQFTITRVAFLPAARP